MDFRNRHVVVTGGTGALGATLVGMLLDAGATCHIPWKIEAEHRAFGHRDHARVRLIKADLVEEDDVAHLYESVPQLSASIHLAGGFATGEVAKTHKAALMQQLDMNFVSCALCCSAAVRTMRQSGQGGCIVNVAARPALEWRSGAGMAIYTASKAAVAALTVALAEEEAKNDILVNAVAPSIMDTAANRAAMPKADYTAWPKTDEVAQTILFLASSDNRVTRGAIVPVYGKS